MNADHSKTWDQAWHVAAAAPKLEPLDLHLWYLALDTQEDESRLWDCLTDDERRRADRFHFPQHRRRFFIGRGWLRQILSSYLGVEPAEVPFEYSGLGKPRIRGSQPNQGICFNFSNSHERALLGVARDVELGVDIERLRPMQSLAGMAQRFFAEPEQQAILTLPEPKRTESFFCCWTRKEAFLKAIGKGLTFPLSHVVVDVHRQAQVAIRTIQDPAHQAAQWSLQHLEIEPDYVAAAACRRRHNRVRRFRWQAAW